MEGWERMYIPYCADFDCSRTSVKDRSCGLDSCPQFRLNLKGQNHRFSGFEYQATDLSSQPRWGCFGFKFVSESAGYGLLAPLKGRMTGG